MNTLAQPEPGGPVPAATGPFEWESDADRWAWAATPGGGVLIVRPQGSSWVPAWTSSGGFILWRGEPCKTRLAAQWAAEGRVRR